MNMNTDQRINLFCLPSAGSSASIYREWEQASSAYLLFSQLNRVIFMAYNNIDNHYRLNEGISSNSKSFGKHLIYNFL